MQNEFVVHPPRREHLDEIELASEEFPPDVSKVDEIGFSLAESSEISVPGLAEPPIRMECLLRDQFPVAGGKVTVFLGEVVCFHIEEGLLEESGRVDPENSTPYPASAWASTARRRTTQVARDPDDGYSKTKSL